MSAVPEIYVTGGTQRKGALRLKEWQQFEEAIIASVGARGGVSIVCSHITPPAARPSEPSSVLFKSGSLVEDLLYTCTQTEVLIYHVPAMELVANISLPCFNDVHHVVPTEDGHLLVANTGLDMVIRIDREGCVLEEWSVIGTDMWSRFDRGRDYRRVLTTKPHAAHPNFVFRLGDEVWVTRFEPRDAISLSRPHRRIDLSVGQPHDGVLFEDRLYFTTVNGFVVVVDSLSLEVTDTIDLNASNTSGRSLGWCRGLLADEAGFWVGFSRLRPTRWQANVSWVRHGFNRVGQYNSLPTRMVRYDKSGQTVEATVDLEEAGVNAVFSLMRRTGSGP